MWLIAQVPGVEEAVRKASETSWEATFLVVLLSAAGMALAAIGVAVYRGLRAAGVKGYELGERYVASNETLTESLQNSLAKQTEACVGHKDGMVALCATEEERDAVFRRAAIAACNVCESIVRREFPNSAPEVTQQCGELKRIISDSAR